MSQEDDLPAGSDGTVIQGQNDADVLEELQCARDRPCGTSRRFRQGFVPGPRNGLAAEESEQLVENESRGADDERIARIECQE